MVDLAFPDRFLVTGPDVSKSTLNTSYWHWTKMAKNWSLTLSGNICFHALDNTLDYWRGYLYTEINFYKILKKRLFFTIVNLYISFKQIMNHLCGDLTHEGLLLILLQPKIIRIIMWMKNKQWWVGHTNSNTYALPPSYPFNNSNYTHLSK